MLASGAYFGGLFATFASVAAVDTILVEKGLTRKVLSSIEDEPSVTQAKADVHEVLRV